MEKREENPSLISCKPPFNHFILPPSLEIDKTFPYKFFIIIVFLKGHIWDALVFLPIISIFFVTNLIFNMKNSFFSGGSTYRRANCWIQRGLFVVWQGWRWHYHHQGIGHCHEIFGPKPNRSWTSRHDQWGRRRR